MSTLEKYRNDGYALLQRLKMFASRYRWQNLIAATLLGLALSRLLYSLLVQQMLTALPEPKKAPGARSIVQSRASAEEQDLTSIIGGPLFPTTAGTTTEEGETLPAEEIIDFELIATIQGDPSIARAVIRTQGKDAETREYKTWAKIGTAQIIYIGREYIWYRQNGQKIKLLAGESTKQARESAVAVASAGNESGGTFKKVISREELNRYLKGNMEEIYKNASFGPKLVDGKITGYKIKRVKSGHIFYKLGARSGDVITSVNGYPLSSTERMFEIWQTLPSMNNIKVELERGGKPITYDFQIQN